MEKCRFRVGDKIIYFTNHRMRGPGEGPYYLEISELWNDYYHFAGWPGGVLKKTKVDRRGIIDSLWNREIAKEIYITRMDPVEAISTLLKLSADGDVISEILGSFIHFETLVPSADKRSYERSRAVNAFRIVGCVEQVLLGGYPNEAKEISCKNKINAGQGEMKLLGKERIARMLFESAQENGCLRELEKLVNDLRPKAIEVAPFPSFLKNPETSKNMLEVRGSCITLAQQREYSRWGAALYKVRPCGKCGFETGCMCPR